MKNFIMIVLICAGSVAFADTDQCQPKVEKLIQSMAAASHPEWKNVTLIEKTKPGYLYYDITAGASSDNYNSYRVFLTYPASDCKVDGIHSSFLTDTINL